MGVPVHPRDVGVTVYTTVSGALVLLINNWDIILSEPDVAPVIPAGELTVQLNVVGDTCELKRILVNVLEHIVSRNLDAITSGLGFTIIL